MGDRPSGSVPQAPHPIDHNEWNRLWWEEFHRLREKYPTLDLGYLQKQAVKNMETIYGPMPKAEKGPPWWLKLVAPFLGVQMDFITKAWAWLNGRKLFLTTLLTALPVIATAVYDVACSLYSGTCPASLAQITIVVATIVSVGHKIFKLLGWAELPK